ncbi:MAG: bifunctional oligoribonuclease/PAP phosphatase NrnA [Armatimonadetes bacterium]|nr:bifunctional oligoribonuclease/PAP phosphatase NrnA [Armatimonadota bacterium]
MSDTAVPPLIETIPLAADAIRGASSLVLACHVNPDGDALGSMLGLALALAPLGQSLTLLSQDGVPDIYKFLPGADRVRQTTEVESFDLAVVLDSGDLSRVGSRVRPLIARARRVIDIDHHALAGAFGDIRVLHALAASTSEIVYVLLEALGLPITPDVATCLFTGVITDTGSFRFQNVTPSTFLIAAALLNAGAPPAAISENVFENRTFAATKLLGHALCSLSQTPDGRVVWAHITAQDFAALGAADEDTEGVVNYVRGVRGADVGLLFREMADGKIRISLRSRESVNVAEVAQRFGGGGHKMAAGCTLAAPLPEAEHLVVQAVRAALPSNAPSHPGLLAPSAGEGGEPRRAG